MSRKIVSISGCFWMAILNFKEKNMKHERNPIISVIVPVFNVECFLKECIESILKQNVEELQIILIDDGSTDSSGEICDWFADKDERIYVIHQENAGVSAARNSGLKVAQGKYIVFVDSDDVLPENAYTNLLKFSKNQFLVIGRIQLMSEEGKLRNARSFGVGNISQKEFMEELFEEKRFPYLGYPVDKLFLRKIIERYQLRFDETIKLNEDRLFVLNYLLHCENVQFCEEVVYYYRQRNTGVIAETRRNVTVTDGEMTVLVSFQKMKEICKEYSEKLYYICSRKAFESALDLLNRVGKEDKEKKIRLKQFLWENSVICIKNPDYRIKEKMKIIVHTVLKK